MGGGGLFVWLELLDGCRVVQVLSNGSLDLVEAFGFYLWSAIRGVAAGVVFRLVSSGSAQWNICTGMSRS